MHAYHRVAHGHGVPGISVIPPFNGYKIHPLIIAAGDLVLNRHLHGCLYRHRAGISVKNLLKTSRNNLHQTAREFNSRIVSQTTKHHVGQCLRLILQSFN